METQDEFVKAILAEAEAHAESIDDAELLAGKRVLVVDDNKLVRQVFHAQLTAFEMIPEEAENGYTGLAVLRRCHQSKTPIDVILLDMLMPEMDGNEMLRQVRQRDYASGIPVIVTTTQNQMDLVQACARLGITDYLLKPVVPDRLRQALRKAFLD